mmetsp:Transcript_61370/g.179367  ORF Transcript_61370/g.179367 Transcript_61370/m.179367 type:complete len:341 (-) Transcript_61370:76-1098(-)
MAMPQTFGSATMYAPLSQQHQLQGYGSAEGGAVLPMAMPVPVEKCSWVTGLQQRKPFVPGQRRRLNFSPLLLCLFAPWVLFVIVSWVSSFSVRHDNPYVFYFVMAACAIVVLVLIGMAVSRRLKLFSNGEREPSWIIFLATSMAVALALSFLSGNRSYTQYMRPYIDFHNLNAYTNIYPDRMRGQQLMDAGAVQFAEGTTLDIGRSMGFKHGSIYCVAPISYGNETMKTYDFWAVGTDCCSGNQADFHCSGWNGPHGGGFRLMGGGREYYRLAVQQAEATYGIKAAHPLFFTWASRPLETIEDWYAQARSAFIIGIFAYLLLQAFLVVCAALAFSKINHF